MKWRELSVEHKYSKETLWHFQCGLCYKWWTIGDFDPEKDTRLFCPSCGKLAYYEEMRHDI